MKSQIAFSVIALFLSAAAHAGTNTIDSCQLSGPGIQTGTIELDSESGDGSHPEWVDVGLIVDWNTGSEQRFFYNHFPTKNLEKNPTTYNLKEDLSKQANANKGDGTEATLTMLSDHGLDTATLKINGLDIKVTNCMNPSEN